MERTALKDEAAYRKVIGAFKRQPAGLTVADVVARTALPLETVKSLLPAAADEYSARLRVTESGEILYTFPKHLKSKYKGVGVFLRRVWQAARRGIKTAATAVFKVWIMLMLVGYFVLFMLIALAAMLLSVAASSSNSGERRDGGGGFFLFSGILDLIIRIWFFSELTRSLDRSRYGYGYAPRRAARPKGRPLYKAIFSFVFGDGDPNADIETREKQAFIAYTQANNGIISFPEFMTLTGLPPAEADAKIVSYCVQFGGSPEPSGDGQVIYVFEQLLRRADTKNRAFAGFSAPLKRLNPFSANEKKMNVWFSVINGVNLFFGGYFLYNTLTWGQLLTQSDFQAAPRIYSVASILLQKLAHIGDPTPLLTYGLGVVPLAFSALFWLIPALRSRLVKKENRRVKMNNLRKLGYKVVLDKRLEIRASDINPQVNECRPDNAGTAKEEVIKEMGAYSMPAVSIDDKGEAVYTFDGLDAEMRAVSACRAKVSKDASSLGGIVFDTDR